MVPGSHFDHPGKSPFMDMSLVPIYASDPRIVHVSAEEQRRLGLITASAGLRDHWYGVISTEGDITYDERNVRDITIRVNARVSKFYPFHKGLVIKKGRPLYELSSPEVYTDLLHFLTLHQNAGKINAVSVDNVHIVQQSHTTLRWRGIPEATIQHVLETGKATDHFLVRAPITGLVLTRNAVQGTLINAGVRTGQFTTYGEVVAKLADISFVYAEAKLWGDQMDYVKPGMTAKVRPEGSNDWYVAKVTYVYPTLKPGKRFGIARIALNNPHYRLKPGMFATIRIQVPEAKDVVVVPRAAVTYLPSGQFVYVRVDGTHFERRKVQVSAPVDGDVPVVRGLRKGEQVVTSGSFFLNADRELRRG